MARLGVPVVGREKKLRAVEDLSTSIPEGNTSELGGNIYMVRRAVEDHWLPPLEKTYTTKLGTSIKVFVAAGHWAEMRVKKPPPRLIRLSAAPTIKTGVSSQATTPLHHHSMIVLHSAQILDLDSFFLTG